MGAPTPSIGDRVQTPLGKGIVREIRNAGRVLVAVGGRAFVMDAGAIRPLEGEQSRAGRTRARSVGPSVSVSEADESHVSGRAVQIDLHGLTVIEALARVASAINEGALAGTATLRFVHGRSGGRIRAALHRQLGGLPAVRAFRIDPRNAGVTVVDL